MTILGKETLVTFASPDPIVSTVPYRVIELAGGAAPRSLDDFVGDAGFTIDGPSGRHVIAGAGARYDAGVRFHEKDVAHTGKDVRVWEVTDGNDDGFVARHAAAI